MCVDVCVWVHATKKDLSAEQTWRIRNIKYTTSWHTSCVWRVGLSLCYSFNYIERNILRFPKVTRAAGTQHAHFWSPRCFDLA